MFAAAAAQLFEQLDKLATLDKPRALTKGAQVFLDDMQANTPVVTGHLRDSEHLVVDGENVDIAVDADYAADV